MTTEERTPRSDRPDQPADEHRDQHPGQEHVEATIENLLREERIFPPPLAFKAQANIQDVAIYDRAATEEGFRAFWAEEAKRIDWIEPWTELLDWQMPYAKWFVGGKLNISANCLDRHVANGLGEQGRLLLGGRARRHPDAHLPGPAGRDVPDGQRPARAGRQEGRPGRHLHAHDPGAADRHAGLRPHRRAAQRRLRRLQRRCPGGTHRGRRVRGGDHRRRRLSQGRHRAAQGQRGRGDRPDLIGPALRGRQAHGRRGRLDGGSGPWWHDLVEGQPTMADPEPMDSEDLLYLLYTSGTTAKPKGIMHTTGGYLVGTQRHPSVHLRHQAGRRVLVHGRHRLGDRPLVHRLRPARECARPGSSTRAPSTTPTRTDGPRSRPSTAPPSCTPPRPPSAR